MFVGGFVLVVRDLVDSRHRSSWQRGDLGLLAVFSSGMTLCLFLFLVSAPLWFWVNVLFFVFDLLPSFLVYLP